MKSMVAAVLVALALFSQSGFAACGGGGWTKPKVADNDSSPARSTTTTSVAPSSSTTVVKSDSRTVVTPAATTTASTPVIIAPSTFDASHKAFDTAQFDAVSAKLGLSEDQWKNVQKAKSDISDDLNKLIKSQRKAEHKYATCDGDCSSEYNKLNRTTEALKSYDPSQEFDRRLAEILQPAQLQTYQSDSKTAAVKKS